jgi:hypothetical protein
MVTDDCPLPRKRRPGGDAGDAIFGLMAEAVPP